MSVGDDYGLGERVSCECGWSGTEDELEMDYYEQYSSVMPLATLCARCGNDVA